MLIEEGGVEILEDITNSISPVAHHSDVLELAKKVLLIVSQNAISIKTTCSGVDDHR